MASPLMPMLQESLAKSYVGDISHPTILSKSDSQIKNLFVLQSFLVKSHYPLT